MENKRSYQVPWTDVLELKTGFLICQSGVNINDIEDEENLFYEDF